MFDSLTRNQRRHRAGRRAPWIAASMALQVAALAGFIIASDTTRHKIVDGPVVPVKFVHGPQAAPLVPPTPAVQQDGTAPRPPAPARNRGPAARPRSTSRASPRTQASAVTPARPDPRPDPEPAPAEHVLDGPQSAIPAQGMHAAEDSGGGVPGGSGGSSGSSPSAPSSGPASFGAGMTPPRLIDAPPLEYTREALDHNVEGTMIVECIVTVEGNVRGCHVVQSVPFMDRAVITNLEHRRYRPATLAGTPLDVQYKFTIKLKLPD